MRRKKLDARSALSTICVENTCDIFLEDILSYWISVHNARSSEGVIWETSDKYNKIATVEVASEVLTAASLDHKIRAQDTSFKYFSGTQMTDPGSHYNMMVLL